MVVLETAAILGGVRELFMYNRENFQFNREQNIERVYHTQKMRVEQVALYREDVRDLFGLTIGKMDNYLIINTLTLSFCLGFFYEGKIPSNTPAWLFWLWAMSLATAIFYLILSVWFSIHASITAQTFAVRLLTQWLRLPVPGLEQINLAAAKLQDYEKTSAAQMLRIPLIGRLPVIRDIAKKTKTDFGDLARDKVLQERFPAVPTEELGTIQQEYDLFMEHFYLFSKLQVHWQGFDAYARVCMVNGANQLLNVIAYMGLAYYLINDGQWGAWAILVLMVTFAIIHAKLNLLLTAKELYLLCAGMTLGPVIAGVAASLQYSYKDSDNDLGTSIVSWLSPFCYLCHLVTMAMLVRLGVEEDGALPSRYSTVISIDVLGIDKSAHEKNLERVAKAAIPEAPVADIIPQNPNLKRAEIKREQLQQQQKGGVRTAPATPRGGGGSSSSGATASHPADPHQDGLAPGELPHGGLQVTGGELAPEDPGLKTSAKKARTLPWHSYKQGSAVVLLLWVIAFVWSLLVLSGVSEWAWGNEYVQATGHRRLSEVSSPYTPILASARLGSLQTPALPPHQGLAVLPGLEGGVVTDGFQEVYVGSSPVASRAIPPAHTPVLGQCGSEYLCTEEGVVERTSGEVVRISGIPREAKVVNMNKNVIITQTGGSSSRRLFGVKNRQAVREYRLPQGFAINMQSVADITAYTGYLVAVGGKGVFVWDLESALFRPDLSTEAIPFFEGEMTGVSSKNQILHVATRTRKGALEIRELIMPFDAKKPSVLA